MAGAVPVQTQEDLVPPPPIAVGYRLVGVLLAPAVAVAVHVALIGPFGLDLQVPEQPGSSSLGSLDLLATALVALGVGLVGWLTVALLERSLGGPRGRRIWMILAFAFFVLSLVPVIVLDVPMGAKWGLFALHVVVATVLIPTLSNGRTAPAPVPGAHGPDAAEAQEAPSSKGRHAPTATHAEADATTPATNPATAHDGDIAHT